MDWLLQKLYGIKMNSDVVSLLTLQGIKGYGKKRVSDILSLMDTINVNSANELYDELVIIRNKLKKIPSRDEIELLWSKSLDVIDKSKEKNIIIFSRNDDSYPSLLKNIDDPPVLLHTLGNLNLLNVECVAVVGTRKPSNYSLDSAKNITEKLVQSGYCIVSGLAQGIDRCVHNATLENNGFTIAVLAHGLHTISQKNKDSLEKKILENKGLIISEYPLGTTSNKGFFIERDRVQSGLSKAVFVVETKINGGTMHTANFCKKQSRELFTLKHPEEIKNLIDVGGNTELLNQGAIPFNNDTNIESINSYIKKDKPKNKNIMQKDLSDY